MCRGNYGTLFIVGKHPRAVFLFIHMSMIYIHICFHAIYYADSLPAHDDQRLTKESTGRFPECRCTAVGVDSPGSDRPGRDDHVRDWQWKQVVHSGDSSPLAIHILNG